MVRLSKAALPVAALTLALAGPVQAGYVAYAVTDGDRVPLPEHIDDIDARFLLNLDWGDYSGRRSRVGVLEVDNTSAASTFSISSASGSIDFQSHNTGVPVNGIEAIVTDVMNRTGRFRLVERKELGATLAEQDLASSGRVSKPSGAATGKVLGAEYLVQVVVTNYEPNVKGKKSGVGGLLRSRVPVLGGVKLKNESSVVGLNFRLIDAETSEIMFTKQVESVIQEKGLTFGGIGLAGDLALGGFMDSYSRTPIGQAVIAGINEGVYELVKQIGQSPTEGSVIKADAEQLYVNLGDGAVSVGDRLQVYSVGEALIDPETGISLGSEDEYLGDIEVMDAREQFSIARPLTLSRIPERGDQVNSSEMPPEMEFAASWSAPK